jgi:MOSC domain-containing protein YiiM
MGDPAPEPDTAKVSGSVLAVCRDGAHAFSKPSVARILLVEGIGVQGDAHAGVTVQHRSRVARDPSQPNLRQVHLMHRELFDELACAGYTVAPGDLGENVTTDSVDLLMLPEGSLLHLGRTALVRVTGLRNPCAQINDFAAGLMRELVFTDDHGGTVRKAGVMGVVERGGYIHPGDPIRVELPAGEPRGLQRV